MDKKIIPTWIVMLLAIAALVILHFSMEARINQAKRAQASAANSVALNTLQAAAGGCMMRAEVTKEWNSCDPYFEMFWAVSAAQDEAKKAAH